MSTQLYIEQEVRVVNLSDETGPAAYLGKVGRVTMIYPAINVGGSIGDPMWVVLFEDDNTETFWSEELEVIA